MALATPKVRKRLADFLNEKEEPFILEVYLSQSEDSKRWSSDGDSSLTSEKPTTHGLNNRKKGILIFFQVLKGLYNKLAFHKESKNSVTKFHDQRNKHEGVPESFHLSDRISTMFNSCSDNDEEGTSIFSHRDQHLFYSHTSRNMEPQRRKRQRCIEGNPELLRKIPVPKVPNVSEDMRRMQQRIRSFGVIQSNKITEDSLLSAAIWSSLLNQSIEKENCTRELGVLIPRTNEVSQILKSKRVLHRIKKMLFDCVKDIAITLPTEHDRKKGYKQLMGPLEKEKLIRQRTKEWDQQAVGVANLTNLLTLDSLNSIMEWCKFESQVKDISVEITNAILDDIKYDVVSDMIGNMKPNI